MFRRGAPKLLVQAERYFSSRRLPPGSAYTSSLEVLQIPRMNPHGLRPFTIDWMHDPLWFSPCWVGHAGWVGSFLPTTCAADLGANRHYDGDFGQGI